MSTDRDVNRIVRSWLEEGVTALPDRVLDTVLDQLPATPQRRAWWPARRFREMNAPLRIAIAAAAVATVAFVGINVLPRQGGVGSIPTRPPSPSPSPSPITTGSLEPGTYFMSDKRDVTSGRLVFTIAGQKWRANDIRLIGKLIDGSPGQYAFDVSMSSWLVGNLKADPCHWKGGGQVPPVGPTVDDLANALVAQAGAGATSAPVTLGGYSGKKVDFSAPPGLDSNSCDEMTFSRWQPADDPTDWGGFLYGKDQLNTVYILDVNGKRQVIDTMRLPTTSAATLAELEATVASIRLEP